MILECAQNDVMPIYISLYNGNEPRLLTYDNESGDYEQIRFKCKVATRQAEDGTLNDDDTPGAFTIVAESNKEDSGADTARNGIQVDGDAKNFLKVAIDMAAIKAIPGRYPIEVSIVSYKEDHERSRKEEDTERHKTTVAFADESYLIIHGEVE